MSDERMLLTGCHIHSHTLTYIINISIENRRFAKQNRRKEKIKIKQNQQTENPIDVNELQRGKGEKMRKKWNRDNK